MVKLSGCNGFGNAMGPMRDSFDYTMAESSNSLHKL